MECYVRKAENISKEQRLETPEKTTQAHQKCVYPCCCFC